MHDLGQSHNLSVTLRWGTSRAKSYAVPSDVETLSLRWSYVVWKRRRWRDDEFRLGDLAQRAVQDLGKFRISEGDLAAMAEAKIVEVGMPSVNRSVWYMPWEFLLAIATSQRRAGTHLLVVRRLLEPATAIKPSKQRTENNDSPKCLMVFVQSAPGSLRPMYHFDTEYKLVRRALKPQDDKTSGSIEILNTPTLKQLEEIPAKRPVLVHFTGVDSREGSVDLGRNKSGGWRDPGFFLQGPAKASEVAADLIPQEPCADPAQPPSQSKENEDSPEVPVSGEHLGKALKDGAVLVTVNCYHSSSLAADIVNQGAKFAIGFQDEVDDPLMELFFANFYRELITDGELQNNQVVRNFWKAMEAARREKAGVERGTLRGTGIVLWTQEQLPLECPPEDGPVKSLEANVPIPALSDGGARSILDFDIRPFPALNYSLLHNDRSLFRRFVIKTAREGTVFDLRVLVELEVAGFRHSYSTVLDLRDFYANLSKIRVSLTSDLLRNLQENVYSSLHVKVQCQGQLVHENTHRILLLPINEWKDDHLNGAWLPSFVLPNDPAISRITRAAKKYLKALTDDSMIGFDGYQSATDEDCGSVDKQVQAIWNALLLDFRTDYINPPPAFEVQSQRIRTPSQILAQERGTCIDLSLLFAACLEYIDVHPALFLLTGHAFMGYFSTIAAHDAFGKLFASYFTEPIGWSQRGGISPQPWVLEKDARRGILDMVQMGGLVPLETTFLCTERGFFDALQQGRKNLTDPTRFESVFDVRRARQHHVVPLPIGGDPR